MKCKDIVFDVPNSSTDYKDILTPISHYELSISDSKAHLLIVLLLSILVTFGLIGLLMILLMFTFGLIYKLLFTFTLFFNNKLLELLDIKSKSIGESKTLFLFSISSFIFPFSSIFAKNELILDFVL